jgi:hypothetical protein
MKKLKKVKLFNYGKALAKYMKDHAVMKDEVAEAIGLSRPTLDKRLVDGEFIHSHMEKVKQILPAEYKPVEKPCGTH